MGVFDQRQSADARPDADADLLALLPVEIDAGVLECIDRSGKTVMDEDVEAACFLGGKPFRNVEILHLPRDLGRERTGVKMRDAADAGFTGNDVGPGRADSDPDRRYDAETGYDYSASCQFKSVALSRGLI